MLDIKKIEEKLKYEYPHSLSSSTQIKRQENINAIKSFITEHNKNDKLAYQKKEKQLIVFETSQGEKVAIQFPGKESERLDKKNFPYDFRPEIIKNSEGAEIMPKDMNFSDMWGIVEKINKDHKELIPVIAALFFRIGRMVNHFAVNEDYTIRCVNSNGEIKSTSTCKLKWNKLTIDEDIIKSHNTLIEPIDIDGICFSFEAFVYSFDLILQNEDNKYYHKKKNLSSGRIQTSDSILLIASYFLEEMTLSSLIQRFVSGFGVGRCNMDEIEKATGGLIRIINVKATILSKLDEKGIEYKKSSSITKNGKSISVPIKFEKIALLTKLQ